ncbi:MAG: arylformamidase [Sulfobacillus sp.]
MKHWIDVSQRIDGGTPVWPGDTPFTFSLTWTTLQSGSVNVGQVTMSTHTGTHVDAPFHFNDMGARTIELDLDLYIGLARVIFLPQVNCISPDVLDAFDLSGAARLLIRTGAWTDIRVFPHAIPSVDPLLAPFLAEKGILLLGVDLPSVDALDSKELPAHHALANHGIQILEGLVLQDVLPGLYDLIALPLPLADGDGSPVRAVLRPRSI